MAQHPGCLLSRSCIHDTLQSKRNGSYTSNGLAHSLYAVTIKSLRATQFAPCAETLQPLRYLHRYQQKKAAPQIAVIIRGRKVVEVRSSNPYTTVWIADEGGDAALLEEAMEHAAAPDMHTVYNSAEV